MQHLEWLYKSSPTKSECEIADCRMRREGRAIGTQPARRCETNVGRERKMRRVLIIPQKRKTDPGRIGLFTLIQLDYY